MQQKQVERAALRVGIIANAFMGTAGMVVFFMTGLEALFLDAAFTIVALISGIVAIVISKQSMKTTDRFPNGMFALEPLYAVAKALLTMALLLFSTMTVTREAAVYLATGDGDPITVGPVVYYELLMVAICLGMVLYYRRRNRSIGNVSTILDAESRTTLVDGILSAGIGIVALVILFIPIDSPLGFMHYLGDFFITIALVAYSVKEPIAVLRNGLVELIGGVVVDDETIGFAQGVACTHIPGGTTFDHLHVFKQGMSHTVDIYLRCENDTIDVSHLDECKRSTEQALAGRLHIVDVNYIFD